MEFAFYNVTLIRWFTSMLAVACANTRMLWVLSIKKQDEITLQQSPFPVNTSFENTLFVDTPLIGEELKQIYKSHGGYLHH